MAQTSREVEKTLGLRNHRLRIPLWLRYAAGGAVIVGGLLGWVMLGGRDAGIRYVTAAATIADLRVTVTATGTIEPTNLVEISSELSGTLSKLHVDFNDAVAKGSILAELDTAKLDAQVAVSKAALNSRIARVAMARATLEDALEKYKNAEALEARGITAHQTFVTQQANYARAKAELQSALADQNLAEAELDLYQTELDKACICSPIDGIVLDRAIDEGQIVAATLQAPVLFTVAGDLTKMELQVDIDEADIGRTAVGNHADFTVEAYDERVFPAQISEIRFAPRTIDGVVTYKALLTIDNADLALRPGMTATADITVAEIADALTVPNAALRYAPAPEPKAEDDRSGLLGMIIPQGFEDAARADNRTLWVLRDGSPLEIAVRPGETDGRRTAILEGDLKPGDLVITDRVDG
jgi:HlyD family secretion protein